MVLSDKAKPRAGILKRTIIYVLGFGFGSLAIAGVLALSMMSIADAVIPSKNASTASSTGPNIIGAPDANAKAKSKTKLSPKPASKARQPRANEGRGAAKKSSKKPL